MNCEEFNYYGEYQKLIGRGTYGEVYKVRSRADGCAMALKVVKLPSNKGHSGQEGLRRIVSKFLFYSRKLYVPLKKSMPFIDKKRPFFCFLNRFAKVLLS